MGPGAAYGLVGVDDRPLFCLFWVPFSHSWHCFCWANILKNLDFQRSEPLDERILCGCFWIILHLCPASLEMTEV